MGHNPAREDSSLWHFCPDHYDVSRPLYVRVCGLKAAIHIDQVILSHMLAQPMHPLPPCPYRPSTAEPGTRVIAAIARSLHAPRSGAHLSLALVAHARCHACMVGMEQRGVIWLNLSQLMKLVGKTKKQTLDLYGEVPVHMSAKSHTDLNTRA